MVTKTVMTEITFVGVDGTGVTVAAPIRGTSTARTAHARIRESIATGLVQCTRSEAMATATTTTTTAVVAGMAATVAGAKTITIIVQIAAAVTRSSKATIPACLNVKLMHGKAMAGATTETTSAVAIGMVVTAVPKQTRNCQRHLSFTVRIAYVWMKRKLNAAENVRCSPGLGTKSVMTKTTTADATGTEGIAVDSPVIIAIVTNAHVWMKSLSTPMLSARKTAPCISGKVTDIATTTIMFVVATGTVETAVDTQNTKMSTSMAIARSANAAILL